MNNTNQHVDLVLRAVNLDKAATHAFYTHLMTSHPGTKFITRNVTGTNEFVAHEMTIELRAGDDLKELGAKKGQLVRFNGVSLQSWQKQGHETSASNEDVANWKILEQKEYFYVEEVLDE